MPDPLFDLTGRVAVVTGAASGLGRAMSLAFAQYGADLAIVDRNTAGLESTAKAIGAMGRRAVSITCDVSNEDSIRSLFVQVDHEFGRIDVLGNVAGDGIMGIRPEEISTDVVKTVMQNLVVGRFLMCQEAGKRMLAAGRGSIINIGSLASVSALGRGHIAYSMAMGAVAQMTRELSVEWASRGVRVNAILPAQVTNPNLVERMTANPAMKDKWLSGIPRGRLGEPSDIQGLAVFLASDASNWITGTLIPMDGGNLAMNAGGTIGS